MSRLFFAMAFIVCTPVFAMPDFTPFGTQPGLTFPLRDTENCATCHAVSEQSAEAEYFPHNTWSGSMLANAARDPLFWAALDVANNDLPGSGDFCLRCHTPKAWLEGNVSKNADGGIVDGSNGCYLPGAIDQVDTGDSGFQGVSCHFCHRLEPETSGQPSPPLDNANTLVDDAACPGSGEPCRKGPYGYEDGGITPAHAWKKSDFVSSSELCASCHDVSSPRVDETNGITQKLADGTDTGRPFPVERTYTEWLNSDFSDLVFRDALENTDELLEPRTGKTCQQCHMPIAAAPQARAANYDVPGRRAGNLPVHQFAGGNAWMPRVLASEYGEALGRTAAF